MVVTTVGGAEQAPVGGDAQLFLKQEFIQNEADPVLCLPFHRVHGTSVYGDSAAVLLIQVYERPYECGLPGSVAADEPEDISRLQGQGDIFKMQRTDAFFKIFDLKQGFSILSRGVMSGSLLSKITVYVCIYSIYTDMENCQGGFAIIHSNSDLIKS